MDQIERHLSKRTGPPLLMGVVNVTPDSFFDGGRYTRRGAAIAQIDRLLNDGADLIDLGAESSRPGAEPVSAQKQWARMNEPLRYALSKGVFVSVDTTDPEVAEKCLQLGAQMINDVSCLRDSKLAEVAQRHQAWLVIMHSRAPMADMVGYSEWPDNDYADIVQDVTLDWGQARQRAIDVGVPTEKIVFDPGLGFSKNARHSFELLKRLKEFHALNAVTLVGASRKSFIAAVSPTPPEQRLPGSLVSAVHATRSGATMLRVHDVGETKQALLVDSAIQDPTQARSVTQGRPPEPEC